MGASRRVTAWLCVFYAAALGAETITINQSRPLSKLALELQQKYGYPVTYEEAPYDASALRTETRSNGSLYSSPGSVPIVFHVPDVAVGRTVSAGADRVPFGLPDVVMPLVKEYNGSGNPGTFTVFFEGGYAHIVPAGRVVSGKVVAFQPMLSTTVSFTSKGHSCSDTLDALLARIEGVRGVSIVKAAVPIGALLRHECTVVANALPAREVLAGILDQLGTGTGRADAKPRYSWALLYDSNTGKYFLSTMLVPDLTDHPVADSVQPGQDKPTAVVARPGSSRVATQVAAPRK